MKSIKILDVGCGASKIVGAVGIDHFKHSNVDIVHDLNLFPWPIESNSVEKIIFCHSISHLNNICDVMIECNRILVDGGSLEIVAPHFSSDNFKSDPTHVFSLGYRSMNYFVNNIKFGYKYLNDNNLFYLEKRYISFREAPSSWRMKTKTNLFKLIFLEDLFNLIPRIYEKYFCSILPASEIHFLLKKIPDL